MQIGGVKEIKHERATFTFPVGQTDHNSGEKDVDERELDRLKIRLKDLTEWMLDRFPRRFPVRPPTRHRMDVVLDTVVNRASLGLRPWRSCLGPATTEA